MVIELGFYQVSYLNERIRTTTQWEGGCDNGREITKAEWILDVLGMRSFIRLKVHDVSWEIYSESVLNFIEHIFDEV